MLRRESRRQLGDAYQNQQMAGPSVPEGLAGNVRQATAGAAGLDQRIDGAAIAAKAQTDPAAGAGALANKPMDAVLQQRVEANQGAVKQQGRVWEQNIYTEKEATARSQLLQHLPEDTMSRSASLFGFKDNSKQLAYRTAGWTTHLAKGVHSALFSSTEGVKGVNAGLFLANSLTNIP